MATLIDYRRAQAAQPTDSSSMATMVDFRPLQQGAPADETAAHTASEAAAEAPSETLAEAPLEAPAEASAEGGEQDPDESHWHETFDRFRELKAELGEPADRIGFEKFSARLRKNRADLVAKHSCKGVRFSVYAKDGKAAIKASAIR